MWACQRPLAHKPECILNRAGHATIAFHEKNKSFTLHYQIPSNSTTLYEEYLIYDAINVIGSVGGTLGMCIGFSFTGLISSLLKILQLVNNKAIFANRNLSKSKPWKNGSLKNIHIIEDKCKRNETTLVDVCPRKYIYSEKDLEERLNLFKSQIYQNVEKKMEEQSKTLKALELEIKKYIWNNSVFNQIYFKK